jgi:hypothetical protein
MMPDPREAELTQGARPAVYIDGVPFGGAGGAEWANSLVRAGGAEYVAPVSAEGIMARRTLNVKGICSAMQCPTSMTEHERYAFVRDMDVAWEGSNSRQREVAGWILSRADGDFYLGPLSEGTRDASTFPDAPKNAVAKFHTHPNVASFVPGVSQEVPGAPNLSGPDWGNWNSNYGYAIWQRDWFIYIRPHSAGPTVYQVPNHRNEEPAR